MQRAEWVGSSKKMSPKQLGAEDMAQVVELL
jgi:hypothetical protein